MSPAPILYSAVPLIDFEHVVLAHGGVPGPRLGHDRGGIRHGGRAGAGRPAGPQGEALAEVGRANVRPAVPVQVRRRQAVKSAGAGEHVDQRLPPLFGLVQPDLHPLVVQGAGNDVQPAVTVHVHRQRLPETGLRLRSAHQRLAGAGIGRGVFLRTFL